MTDAPFTETHEHQFPEVDVEGTLVAYPCLFCGMPAGDALKRAAEDRQSFEQEIDRLKRECNGWATDAVDRILRQLREKQP